MGIKGIYGEIGPGNRVALAKLAVDKLEQNGRPLRIAIDISIWQFQIMSGKGGLNPALRTLYYRLLRLLSLAIQPLFVFDGPHKPPFKRDKRTGSSYDCPSNIRTKQLLKLFGFPYHNAPGEAEAECALLQREGIVDAVLSEDVDTLMFGCGLTFRNWSSEGPRGHHAPTHVSVYDANETRGGKAGLDREGMILIALMSGGDYITGGIAGCGIKVACEAARAGFGKSLCKISRRDKAGFENWRQNLAHELQDNESKYFRTKHKALDIPDSFPDMEVLGYYTHPVVSSAETLRKLRDEIRWDTTVNVVGLRAFVGEEFDWRNKAGAEKFIRGLAPVLLVANLLARADRRASGYNDDVLTAINEMKLVRAICGNRTHFSTGGVSELRLVFQPLDIVSIDLIAERDDSSDHERDGLAPLIEGGTFEPYESGDDANSIGRSQNPTKKALPVYDPVKPDKVWIPEAIAKLGIPLKVAHYGAALRNPQKNPKAKPATKKVAAVGGMPKGAMDKYVVTGQLKSGTQTLNMPKEGLASLQVLSSMHTGRPQEKILDPKFSQISARQNDFYSSTTSSKPNRTALLKQSGKSRATTVAPPKPSDPWALTSTSSSPAGQLRVTKAISEDCCLESRRRKATNPNDRSNVKISHPSPEKIGEPQNGSPSLDEPPQTNESHCSGVSPNSPSPRKKHHAGLSTQALQAQANLTASTLSQPRQHHKNSPAAHPHHEAERTRGNSEHGSPVSDANLPFLEDLFAPYPARRHQVENGDLLSIPPPNFVGQNDRVNDLPLSPSLLPANTAKFVPAEDTSGAADSIKDAALHGSKLKRFFKLRDSLEGSWKEVQQDEKEIERDKQAGKPRRTWRMSEVEILDLTGD